MKIRRVRTQSIVAALLIVGAWFSGLGFGFAGLPSQALAQYPGWPHSGSLYILTTPDGADLPASASVDNFPLLVRLTKEDFDFSLAEPSGADIRFSAAGKPLAYQIEQWDAVQGAASIWVRIPEINGNARQEIKLHWGNVDATSESNGAAVFSKSNGFLSVLHMGDEVQDAVGSVETKDVGTTPAAGRIGTARHFAGSRGILCGEKIENYPVGAGPHSTEAWIRAEQSNGRVVAWGNEHGQGKVVMQFRSPPHVSLDCYFSGANVSSQGRLPMNEWLHLVHTYEKGDSRIYVNGELSNTSKTSDAPLAIKSPARFYIGGWYNHYDFVGDIDEVRISNVTRSAEWVKLQYENQKPMQTLIGNLVQPGTEFAVSNDNIVLDEGKSRTLTAKAQGAEKVYWLLSRDGKETVVAVDRFSFTLEAGRVTSNTPIKLRFKAVYPQEVKTIDVPVTVKEAIPEPQFTLQAPTTWNGRDTIEIVPEIKNLDVMRAAKADEVRTRWSVSGGAVIQQIAKDRLILKRSQFSGVLTILAEIDNGGVATVASTSIQVTEPKSDPWVARAADKNEKPEEGQFYGRDESGLGVLYYNGTLEHPADAVFLRVFAEDKPYHSENQPLAADMNYSFAVKLKPGLVKYRIEFGTKFGAEEKVVDRVGDLICGDAYLIDGQSNALATDTHEESPRETSEWIRSYGGPTGRGDGTDWVRDRTDEAKKAGLARQNLWCRPVWKRNDQEQKAELGWWGMELAKRLVESQKVPIFIINGAVGGTRIDEHQATSANHSDLNTIYGRMLWRVQQSRMTHHIRAVIWHQGENDQGADGPSGGFGWQTYQQYFVEMSAAWKEDMPNIQHYYIYQIWPNSCAMGGGDGAGDRLREAQRTLPRLYSNMDIMSTLGIKPPGGCHYPLEGWSQFAYLLQPLIERDMYGKTVTASINPPNLKKATFANKSKNTITLEFDQPIKWSDSLSSQFFFDDKADEVDSGATSGNVLKLKLKRSSASKSITYLKERSWTQEKLLVGDNGIAALTFCDVPIENAE